ncbi:MULTISPECIES: N-acetylmuramoyl-L-alanine amidase [unclassified Kitasatospora]|uniref:N-acetylmuramoyl-L-alanine amidase n=1 Tax=unclassified Kitasatospora TaxID=2633591 RepID=UPI00070B46A0|nr:MULTISPECIES: N-acetylmuramoyl-L-alanine amidase [unclassified Kitasatospora]KQV05696.1 N-acetylmuramoyl-L-alanine amidase [Kitasatospora sp. Root107]KRB62500.1 N-acetylmuramoyl-L-alanine amidase [Kitasatospora sp. Root187]
MTGTTDRRSSAPRRSPLLRLSALACAALPLCAVGCAGPGSSGADAAARPASASPAEELPLLPSFWPTAAPSTPATPSATPGSAAAARPLTGRTVLLDAGHNPGNGKHTTEINRQVDIGNSRKECDTTGTSTNAGYSEAEYSLDVSRRARTVLEERGAKVLFTQDGDRPWGPCIDERARIGNEGKVDAAISVHGDGAPATGSGFHVIMPAQVKAGKADTGAIVAPSRRLGLLLREHFKAATGEPYADYIGEQGLDTRSDLGGLNLSKVPKVFIECGNMRNSGDAKRMTDPQWRQQAAQGIADALTAYLTTAAN